MASQSIRVSTRTKGRRLPKNFVSQLVQYLVNIILAMFFIFPIVFMVVSSFKDNQQIFADLRSLRAFMPVGDLSLANYESVFEKSKFFRFLFNSVFVAIITIVLSLVVNSLVAYTLSRMKWQGQRLV